MAGNVYLTPAKPNKIGLDRKGHSEYRRQVGEILYLEVCKRLDLRFFIGSLARSLHAPSKRHQIMVQMAFRYFSAARKLGIRFARN